MPRVSLLLPLLIAACSSGGQTWISATVQNVTYPATIAGDVTLRFASVDSEPTTVDIEIEVSRDAGSSWRTARITGPLIGLSATPEGSFHEVTWDSLADAGYRLSQGVRLRFRTRSSEGQGAATEILMPTADNLEVAAQRVDDYFIHYGAIDAATEAVAMGHDLVILHPHNGHVPVEVVRRIQLGFDPEDPADDVLVLAYISVGEDVRTVHYTDAEMLLDPRFVGDGTGPRIDPRGPTADGQSLAGIDPLGLPSNGGTGFASFYLDDNSVDRDPGGTGDGLPDRNAYFGGCFVNAGDPTWFEALDEMTVDSTDGVQGIRELLTTGYGRGYCCDGLFLDTIDTCAPNSYTDENSGNQSEFEWTAPGFTAFTRRLRDSYPDKLVLQNRGLFFFDKRREQFLHGARDAIDFLLFESYRLNSNTFEQFDPYYFPDNKYNVAPKLMAEANRADGFRVLSLGYAEGPAEAMSALTLNGGSTLGLQSLLDDIHETEQLVGFRHYLTDRAITWSNTFVRDRAARSPDLEPPIWSSTHNENAHSWPVAPEAPVPRIGIRDLEVEFDRVTVRWDVALDLDRVRYVLYYTAGDFDFVSDPTLTAAERIELEPELSSEYLLFAGHPYQAVVTGLQTGTRYAFCLRAIDESGNEDDNQIVLGATPFGQRTMTIDGSFEDWDGVPVLHQDPADVPASAGPDWLDLQVANDDDWLYLHFTSDDPFNLDGSPFYGFSRTLVFLDADNDPTTGWSAAPLVGSEFLIAGDTLYSQELGVWNVGLVSTLPVQPTTAVTGWEMAVPLAALRAAVPNVSRLRLRMVNDDANDIAPETGAVYYRLAVQ